MTDPISIDDANTTLIQYKGDWVALNGSTRQWDGTVHTTGQAGATATFQFRGYLLWVWGTVAGGTGENLVQLTIDGGPANVTSQTSNGSAIFNVLYFETPLLTETFHTAVITNLGSTTNGSMTEFELDRFEFQTSDVVPLFSPPVGSITSVAPSATSSSTAHTSSSSFKSRLEAIAGGVIGALILIIVFLVYILWRKIKERSAKRESRGVPTPFPIRPPPDTSSPAHSIPVEPTATLLNSQLHQTHITMPAFEKGVSGYPHFRSNSNPPSTSIPFNPTSPISTLTTLNLNTSHLTPVQPTLSELASRDEISSSSIHRHPFNNNNDNNNESPILHSSSSTSDINIYDRPPPAYWKNESQSQLGSSLRRSF